MSAENSRVLTHQSLLRLLLESRDFFFYLAYAIYVVTAFAKVTYLDELIDLQQLSILVPLFLLFQELNHGDFSAGSLITLFLFVIANLFCIFLGNSSLIAVCFLLYSSRRVDFKIVLKLTIALLFTMLLITIVFAKTGLITDSQSYRTNGYVVRHGLGFIGRTYASYVVLSIAAAMVADKGGDTPFRWLFIMFALNFWVFIETGTRNGFILTILVVSVAFLQNRNLLHIKCGSLFAWLLRRVFLVLPLFSYILVFAYTCLGNGLIWLDNILSYRLSYSILAINKFGIHMFGRNIDWSSLNYIVDSSYIRLALDYGVIVLVIFLVIMSAAMHFSFENDMTCWSFILGIYALHFCFDPTISALYLNPMSFLGAQVIYEYFTKNTNRNFLSFSKQLG